MGCTISNDSRDGRALTKALTATLASPIRESVLLLPDTNASHTNGPSSEFRYESQSKEDFTAGAFKLISLRIQGHSVNPVAKEAAPGWPTTNDSHHQAGLRSAPLGNSGQEPIGGHSNPKATLLPLFNRSAISSTSSRISSLPCHEVCFSFG